MLNGPFKRAFTKTVLAFNSFVTINEPRVMLMSIIQQYMSKNVCSIVSLVFSRLSRLGFLDSLDSSLFFRKFIFYMVPRPENIDSLKNSLSLEIWLMKN